MAKIQVGRDIMPERVEPALALLKPKPPTGGRCWLTSRATGVIRLSEEAPRDS